MEKRLQDGRVALPNVKKYYDVAILTACTEWWKMVDDDVTLLLEQEKCSVSQSRWLFISTLTKRDLSFVNSIVKILDRT